MKGDISVVMKATLIIILSMPLALVGAQHLAVSREMELKNNARFLSFEMASIINIMQSAPDGTKHKLELPEHKCKIEILPKPENKVKIILCPSGAKEIFAEMEILETGVEIEQRSKNPSGVLCEEPAGNAVMCDPGKKKPIVFGKKDNRITITDGEQ